jgi:hypothetical protein
MDALNEWTRQQKTGGQVMADQADVKVGAAALEYRFNSLQSDLANGPDKQKFGDAADKVLVKLQQDQPSLRGLILDLMSARVKPDAPIASLNELLLQSLLVKAEGETIKDDDQPIDETVILRGIDAAMELNKKERKVDAATMTQAEFDVPFFYRKLSIKTAKDSDKEKYRIAAAQAFLTFIEKHKDEPAAETKTRVQTAYNNGLSLVYELHKANADEPQIVKLYDRALDIAVGKPFERYEFAFEAGRRKQGQGKTAEAIELYKKVPADHKNAADAKYFIMVSMYETLDKLPKDDPKRPPLLGQIQKIADEVNSALSKQLATAKPEQKLSLQIRLAQTRLLSSGIALRDQKDPKRCIELLNDFESMVKGLPNENDLMGEVMFNRVQAYNALGQVKEATAVVVKLGETRPKETGPIIFSLLQKMGEQQDDAKARGDDEKVAELQAGRAALTPFYVKWIENNPNADLKKQIYNARLFDADTQRQAAELEKDPAKRKTLMENSLKQYEQLSSPDGFKQFLALQPAANQSKLKYDPQVKMGLARMQFGLEKYKEARTNLNQLFYDKTIRGGVIIETNAAGDSTQKDNPNYWEGVYMLIRCNVALNENVDAMKRFLVEQMIIYGDQFGGKLWKKQLEALRQELKVEMPTTNPTTQPAAAAASAG